MSRQLSAWELAGGPPELFLDQSEKLVLEDSRTNSISGADLVDGEAAFVMRHRTLREFPPEFFEHPDGAGEKLFYHRPVMVLPYFGPQTVVSPPTIGHETVRILQAEATPLRSYEGDVRKARNRAFSEELEAFSVGGPAAEALRDRGLDFKELSRPDRAQIVVESERRSFLQLYPQHPPFAWDSALEERLNIVIDGGILPSDY